LLNAYNVYYLKKEFENQNIDFYFEQIILLSIYKQNSKIVFNQNFDFSFDKNAILSNIDKKYRNNNRSNLKINYEKNKNNNNLQYNRLFIKDKIDN